MTILGVECSAVSVSVAVLKGGKIVCEDFQNNGYTHSVTLLPMIKSVIDACNLSVSDIDVFSISAGPGSFTGLRIGAATIKGLASLGGLCLGVSTLEAMAYDHRDFEGIVCPCMDARCSQVYNALFEIGGEIKRLCEDRAVMLPELLDELKGISKPVLLVGDGALLTYNKIKDERPELLSKVKIADERLFQHAAGVCLLSQKTLEGGEKAVSADELILNYLRLPQAERELKKKENVK